MSNSYGRTEYTSTYSSQESLETTTVDSSSLPKIWPGWNIVRLIGGGSYGKVYEIHRRNGGWLERAAMKVIRIPSSPAELEQLRMDGMGQEDTAAYLARHVEEIRSEIGLMQRFVGNSNIVSYEDYMIQKHSYDIGWDIMIRMELLKTLPDYMNEHPFSEEDVIRLGIDISQALIICHKAGIIHRDIKPQNIFINEHGFFKLGDFGISRAQSSAGSVMSFKGTLSYMAPETFAMKGTDTRSDIYSLALVLYRIMNGGREPFLPATTGFSHEMRDAAQSRRLRGEPVPAPFYGSVELKSVLARALAPDPAARYQTAAQFREALQRVGAAAAGGAGSVSNSGIKKATRILWPFDSLNGKTSGRGTRTRDNGDGVSISGTNTYGYKDYIDRGQFSRSFRNVEDRKRLAAICILLGVSFILILYGAWSVLDGKRNESSSQNVAMDTGQNQYTETSEDDTGTEDGESADDASQLNEPEVNNAEESVPQEHDATQGAGGYSGGSPPLDVYEEEDVSENSEDDEETVVDQETIVGNQNDGLVDHSGEADETDGNIEFKDAALEAAVRETLGIRDRPITLEDAAGCSFLNLSGKGKAEDSKITDLTGLSAFSDLEELHLEENRISDISELSRLPGLRAVYMEKNTIDDLGPVRNLLELITLEVNANNIRDLSPVSQCSKLEVLDIRDNSITDISPLRDLRSLRSLAMSDNPIDNIEGTAGLVNLWYLSFNNTQVVDLSPLANLKKLDTLCMSGTDVRDIKILLDLPKLRYLKIENCSNINDTQTIEKLKKRENMEIVR